MLLAMIVIVVIMIVVVMRMVVIVMVIMVMMVVVMVVTMIVVVMMIMIVMSMIMLILVLHQSLQLLARYRLVRNLGLGHDVIDHLLLEDRPAQLDQRIRILAIVVKDPAFLA